MLYVVIGNLGCVCGLHMVWWFDCYLRCRFAGLVGLLLLSVFVLSVVGGCCEFLACLMDCGGGLPWLYDCFGCYCIG